MGFAGIRRFRDLERTGLTIGDSEKEGLGI